MAVKRKSFPELALQKDLPPTDLEALLAELIAAYKEPKFQADIAAKRALIENAGPLGNVRFVLGSLALRVQTPVLTKYGLPATPGGVELLKHMVKRRIAEGEWLVEELANEARQLLGLQPLPDSSESAESKLVERLSEGKGQESRLQYAEALRAARRSCDIPVDCYTWLDDLNLQYWFGPDKNGQDKNVPSMAVLWSFLNMVRVGISKSCIQTSDVTQVPRVDALDPHTDIFETYVLPNKPVILCGAFDGDNFPPLRNFADLHFLRHRCGHRRVLVKSLAHDDKSGRPIFVSDPKLKLPIADFFDALENGGAVQDASTDAVGCSESCAERMPFYLGKVPLSEELPELLEDIDCASTCPQRLYGNCFGSLVPQGVFTYLGRGRNTTPVHYDPYENLMLCICGEKRLLLYPPSDTRYVYPVGDWRMLPNAEFSNSAVPPFASPADLASDMAQKYKLLKNAHPLEVRVQPGEVLYLPPCWWHCVEGSVQPNMTLNWWFDFHSEKRALHYSGRSQRVQTQRVQK